jgi:HlyD family secretion protein
MRWNRGVSRRWVAVFVAVALVVGSLLWFFPKTTNRPPGYATVAITRGDLVDTVSATGTIEPEEVVDVGAQVVGIIQEFGRDPQYSSRAVDFGTVVEVGTVLARIDDSLYRARLDKASALVEQSRAQVAVAEADLKRSEATGRDGQGRPGGARLDPDPETGGHGCGLGPGI